MMGFVHAQPPHDRDREHRLRCVLTAPTPWEIVDDFQRRFGIDVVTEDYGSTEIGLPVLCPYGVTRPAGSCGRLLSDWYDARIVDPATDEELPDGQVGEFVVRPRIPWAISSGYFNMGERTLDSRRNLWFHTGDALRRDADGWYYFVDRINDSLRRRGENISSYEVEQPILAFPDIAEVAVVAVAADSPGGEDEVMAVVVPHRGREIDPAELWIWCDERLPAFARPRFLKIVTELPKTPSEKVRKTALRAVGAAGALDRFAPDSAPS
jgi:crotonobetaine/carnitine-CoA ligase